MLSIVTQAEGTRAPLDRLLTAIARMRPRPFEVVVVDRGGPSVDPSPDVPVRTTTVTEGIIAGDGNQSALARWRGAEVACGSLLLFLDVDCVPAPDLAGEVRTALSRRHGLVMADVRDLEPETADDPRTVSPRPTPTVQPAPASREPVPPGEFRPAAFAVRRAVLDDLRRAADAGPDGLAGGLGDAAARAGVPIWRWPTAIVHRQSMPRQRART